MYPNNHFYEYVNLVYKQYNLKPTGNFLLKFIKVLPILIWRTLKDAAVELLLLTFFWAVLVKMSQGRDLVVSLFENDGLYGNIRIIFTTLAVVSLSVSMWIIPAFMFHQRELRTRHEPHPQNPFHTHLFFMHRVLPMVPFWLLASVLFNGNGMIFIMAGITELVLLYYFNRRVKNDDRKTRFIAMGVIGGVLIVSTIYFFFRFQKEYNSMKLLLAVNLYLLSALMYMFYYWRDYKILKAHATGYQDNESLPKKYQFNTWFYFIYLGIHVALVTAIYFWPFELNVAPESMLLYMFSVYVFAIDLLFYYINITRKRQLTAALVTIILVIVLASPLWNINLSHYTMDKNADSTIFKGRNRDNFGQRYEELKAAINANNSGEAYPIVLISGEGGGSRAGLWLSQNLINFDYDTRGKFRNHIFSMSTVSGSSVGLSTVFSFWDYTRGAETIDSSWIQLPKEVYANNYVGSSVRGLLLTDLYKSIMPGNWKNDRNTTLQYEEAATTAEAIFKVTGNKKYKDGIPDSAMTLKKDLMYFFYENVNGQLQYRKNTPIVLINTCRSNDGRRGIFSSIRLEESFFNDAIDVAGYLYEDSVCSDKGVKHCDGIKKPISLGQACNTSELFPIFSAPAYIDTLGSFVDGGYHENSGLKSTLDVYYQLRYFLQNDAPQKPYKIYILYMKNGSGEKRLYKKINSELTLLQPLRALFNQPFEGSASYFEERAKFVGAIDDNVEFVSVNLNPKILVDSKLAGVKNENERKMESEILKDLINQVVVRDNGTKDTILNFPLARWLSKTVINRIQMCAVPGNRSPDVTKLIAQVNAVNGTLSASGKAYDKYPVHKQLKVKQEETIDTAVLKKAIRFNKDLKNLPSAAY
jgi:hypothetical protein